MEVESMLNLENVIEIAASPHQVWSVLSHLTRSPEYVPGIVSATMKDLTRICFDRDGNEIWEELQYFSATERTYTLQHIKVPLPVKHSQMQFSVQPHEQRALVTLRWDLTFVDLGMESQMRPMIDGSAKLTLEQLKALVEREE
jgi:hypothetical protein